MYNISTFYPYIYEEKFKKRHYLQIDSGWIISNKNVYLDLEDLNMIDDLGHILDFYRKIEKEGNTHRISIHDKKHTTCCNNMILRHMCVNCNKYLCDNCEHEHNYHIVQKNIGSLNITNTCSVCQIWTLEPMIYENEKEICYDCDDCTNDVVLYTKPIIENFNFYEWIPVNGFLENRNINSHMYKRKMSIEFGDEFIKLKLLDINSIDIETDYILRLFEKYGVHEYISENIFKKMGIEHKAKAKEIKEYKTIIISS